MIVEAVGMLGRDVPDLHDHMALRQRLAQPVLRAVLDYWCARYEDGGRLPSRDGISLSELGPLRPHLALVDVIREGADFRFRLAGAHIVHGYGFDVTGRTLSSLRDGPMKRTMLNTYTQVFRTLAPVQYGPRPSVHRRRRQFMTEHLYLPLVDTRGRVDMIMAAVVILEEGQWLASIKRQDSAA